MTMDYDITQPIVLVYLVYSQSQRYSMNRSTSCCHSTTYYSVSFCRHLLYCLLDQMLGLIVPEASSVEVQQELRQGDGDKDAADY